MKNNYHLPKIFWRLLLPVWVLATFYTGLSLLEINFSQFIAEKVGVFLEIFFRSIYVIAGLLMSIFLALELLQTINRGAFNRISTSIKFLSNIFVNMLWFSFYISINSNLIATVFTPHELNFTATYQFASFQDIISVLTIAHLNALSVDFFQIMDVNPRLNQLIGETYLSRVLYWIFHINVSIIFVDTLYSIGRRQIT